MRVDVLRIGLHQTALAMTDEHSKAGLGLSAPGQIPVDHS